MITGDLTKMEKRQPQNTTRNMEEAVQEEGMMVVLELF